MDMQAPYTAPCVQLWLTCSPKRDQALEMNRICMCTIYLLYQCKSSSGSVVISGYIAIVL